ncbi:MAG: hypothetical protein ACRCZF_02180, partial [Gemmataceae bacterium]
AGAPAVIAAREHPQSVMMLPPHLIGYAFRRRLQSLLFSKLTRTLLPIPFHDTQAGLKGFHASVAERLFPELTCHGFGFDCELLTVCAKLGVPVREVPVHVHYDDTASTTSYRSIVRMISDVWHIRRRWQGRTLAPWYAEVETEVKAPVRRHAA